MKKVSFKAKDVNGPPDNEPWLFLPFTLLSSDALRGASTTLRRLLDFLHVEHLLHDRLENGKLVAPYDQLVKAGISRRLILHTILEGEERGLIEVDHGLCLANGKRQPSRYRLTYFAFHRDNAWHAPTHEWRRFKAAPRSGNQVPDVEPVPVPDVEPVKNILTPQKVEPVPVPHVELGSEAKSSISAKNQVPQREPVTSAINGTASTYLHGITSPPAPSQAAEAAPPRFVPSRPNGGSSPAAAPSVIGYQAEEAGQAGDRYQTPPPVNGGANGSDLFERFWRVYPLRGTHANPRKPAAAKFAAAVKHGADPDAIITGAQRYAGSIDANGTEPQFVAQAVTWLNQERWQQYQRQAEPEPAWDDDGKGTAFDPFLIENDDLADERRADLRDESSTPSEP